PDAQLAAALEVVDGIRARVRGDDAEAARATMQQAATARVWDLEVLAGPDTDWQAVRAALPTPSPARLLVLPDDERWETTPAEWLDTARAALGGVVAVVG